MARFRDLDERRNGSVQLGKNGLRSPRCQKQPLTNQSGDTTLAQFGHSTGVAICQITLGWLAFDRGDVETSLATYQEAVRLLAKNPNHFAIVQAWSAIVVIVVADHQFELAATVIGVIDERIDAVGANFLPYERRKYDQAIAQLRERLGNARFPELHAHGRSFPFATAFAAIDANRLLGGKPQIPQPLANRFGPTRREFDVMHLLAQGASDQEIANALFVGLRTINTHVANIIDKLEVPNRRDAVKRARAAGLIPTRADLLTMS